MRTSDVLVAPPTVEPLTRTRAKLHLKSSLTAEDALVDGWIAAARGHFETFCRRAAVLQTRMLLLDCFPGCIELARSPARSVLSIQYLDSAGALQTLATSVYRVDLKSLPARIVLDFGQVWPQTFPVVNAVLVTYTAGMMIPFTADSATDVLTAPGHGFAAADITQAAPLGTAGALPTPLAIDTNYHARDVTADTLKLAAVAGGVAIDITAPGTPPNVLGRLDKEIEAALQLLVQYHEGRQADTPLLEAAERMLQPFRVVRF